MASSCKWVDDTVTHVPYDVITPQLLDEHSCDWVSHGDDMIVRARRRPAPPVPPLHLRRGG
jgi:glycerol-3-phosphate cytidylyltransferase-like family protein